MPFITNHSNKRLTSTIIGSSIPAAYRQRMGNVWKKPIWFYSRYEEGNLLLMKQLFVNPEVFLEIYGQVGKPIRVDLESSIPSYHVDPGCKFLHSDYFICTPPSFITTPGLRRKWNNWYHGWRDVVHQNYKTNPTLLERMLKEEFGQSEPLQVSWRKNSGVIEVKEYRLQQLTGYIGDILFAANEYHKEGVRKESRVYEKYCKMTGLVHRGHVFEDKDLEFTSEEIYTFLTDYEQLFKNPLAEYLIEYYKVYFDNPRLEFSTSFLHRMGFKPCSVCSNSKPLP